MKLVVSVFFLLLLLIVVASYICFRLAFSVPKKAPDAIFEMPSSRQYAPYAEATGQMIRDALVIPYEPVTISSFDGRKLFGKYYPAAQAAESAPWLILFHGYRSCAERDFCGGLPFGIAAGFHVLLVDQRAHGKSSGNCLTLGIKERYDCLSWIRYVLSRAGKDAKIVLYGISMGAATVLMSAGLSLPHNVAGIVADCGYSSPSAIIKKVLQKRHYPLFPTYALVRLGGKLFGGFDIEQASAAEAMKQCDIPVLFIHGEKDHFVPCEMSRENYKHCRSSEREILTVPGAGHGMSYMVDTEAYTHTVSAFLKKILNV